MKKFILVLAIVLCPKYALADVVIHPMDFDGSEAQKEKVIKDIESRVRKDYCDGAVDMCQDTTLRMMEKENLSAFKELTSVKNRNVLDRVIKDYCNSGIDMCNYSTIRTMYNENLKASNDKLEW